MKSSKFVPEVKERQPGQPCFLMLNTYEDIGLGKKQIQFNLPEGTGFDEARELARILKSSGVTVSIG